MTLVYNILLLFPQVIWSLQTVLEGCGLVSGDQWSSEWGCWWPLVPCFLGREGCYPGVLASLQVWLREFYLLKFPPVLSIGYGILLGFLSQTEVHGIVVRLQNSCSIPPLRCCAWLTVVDEARGLCTAWAGYQLAKYLGTLWDEGLWAQQRCCSGDVHWFIAISRNVMGLSSVRAHVVSCSASLKAGVRGMATWCSQQDGMIDRSQKPQG